MRIGRSFKIGGWKSRLIGLLLLAGLLALRIADPHPVKILRNQAFDIYQQIKPRQYEPLPVTIVDIDDQSLDALGQWPWPRSLLADLVARLQASGTVVIGFDIIFSEADRMNPGSVALTPGLPEETRAALAALPANDDLLARAIAEATVVVGQTARRTSDRRAQPAPLATPASGGQALSARDPKRYVLRFPQLLQNLPAIEEAATGRGVFTVRQDPDGVFRRVPVVMLVDDELRLGLSSEMLRVATGGQGFAVRTSEAGVEGVLISRNLIKTAANGTIRPYLTPTRPERYVSAADILTGAVPPERLAGQLVLIGTSAIGLEDFRPTPLGVPMAGVEIHSQALENMINSTLLVRPGYAIGYELVALTGLGLLVILAVPSLGALATILSTLVLTAGYLGGSWYLFDTSRVLLDPTFPLLTALLLIVQMVLANYLREEGRRRQIRDAFGQYVSPDLVNQLADAPERLQLGGETRDITILFSDVRGFTALSESYKADPAGLTVLMNRFLTVLSNAILAERGTIDKFMGDAVMAFWNAPLDHAEHALSGCRAALGMIREIEALNARRAAEGATLPINVGVGLNSGPCVVGNMGSETRFDYTALGDAVNLASRVEGQSKTYGVPIVLGQATADQVADQLALIELDLLRVKGKTEPARIFALLGDEALRAEPSFAALQGAVDAMLAAYRAQDWAGAEAALQQIAAHGPALPLEGLVALYQQRIADYRADPPESSWDGVFVAKSK